MAQIMSNIPRRKIYETMLEFEDALLGIEILTYSQKQYDSYSSRFIEENLPKMQKTFKEIKALLMMFFENEKFANEDEFNKKLQEHLSQLEDVESFLQENSYLPQKFKMTLPILKNKLEDHQKIVENFEKTKDNFELLDTFNHYIPKILELRRDEMIEK